MPALIHCVTVETDDPYTLASWWAEVLGRKLLDDDHPGDPEAVLLAPDGHGPDLLFVQVGERHGKGAFHLDLHAAEGTRDTEVERLLGLGATLAADRRRPDGTGWVVLADPEGNEFCVCRSAAEKAASA
ncbi:VOC family protein [Micromonospora auratinigra]|uniref:Glyoxalase-like domain n=1 Tax=Micromonospora auratinigra TaxID=261654 RepID=A0A1A9AC31_9ACTN|nr:VOC family protein [Micromonospora auratinigra]SBT53666.1 Glyoxalase-like domain [Micromonospora auratinigra]